MAGVINRCGFDMIYFDGGELNSADGPIWYWVGQQSQIWESAKRELLVQGSGHDGLDLADFLPRHLRRLLRSGG